MDFSESYKLISISEFDDLARKGQFLNGPFVSTFGDGYGEPYNPDRPVWGQLKTGEVVRSVK